MREVEMLFGFPLFTQKKSIVSLGKNKEIVVSDIWAFWDYAIKKRNRDKSFLKSCLEQSKFFYETAENSPIRSKPLLYYYSFLNLAKIILNIKFNYGKSKKYRHGIFSPKCESFSSCELKIEYPYISGDKINVAGKLLEVFERGQIASREINLNVKDLLIHCVGVHRAYCEIFNFKEIFFRLKNPRLYKSGKDLLFRSEINSASRDDLEDLKKVKYSINSNNELEVIYQMPSYNITRKNYYELSKKIRDLGIWYILTNNGYSLYVSKATNYRYSVESIIYLLMFYLGSITRYYPYLFDEIFDNKEQWLMSEFLKTQPKQFLYLATANTFGQNILKPYADF